MYQYSTSKNAKLFAKLTFIFKEDWILKCKTFSLKFFMYKIYTKNKSSIDCERYLLWPIALSFYHWNINYHDDECTFMLELQTLILILNVLII